MTQQRRGAKVAPAGYYTAQEAQRRLGLNKSTFNYYVNLGKISRHIPPLRAEGFYNKQEIDQLADTLTLAFLQHQPLNTYEPMVFRAATPDDAQGIYNVLASHGWPATPAEQRKTWYRVNDLIDFVVIQNGLIVGYVNAMPYLPATLEKMMSGAMRGWDVRPRDILPYEPGKSYDLFVGIAVRKDVPHQERYGARLLSGFLNFLQELYVERGIKINRMYATSDQEDGIALCEALGFVRDEARSGDLFGRFVFDVATAASPFARRYRETLSKPAALGNVDKQQGAQLAQAIWQVIDLLNRHEITVSIFEVKALTGAAAALLEQAGFAALDEDKVFYGLDTEASLDIVFKAKHH